MSSAAQPSRSCLGLVLPRQKGNSALAGRVERSLPRAEVCVQCLSPAPVLEVTLILAKMCFNHHFFMGFPLPEGWKPPWLLEDAGMTVQDFLEEWRTWGLYKEAQLGDGIFALLHFGRKTQM